MREINTLLDFQLIALWKKKRLIHLPDMKWAPQIQILGLSCKTLPFASSIAFIHKRLLFARNGPQVDGILWNFISHFEEYRFLQPDTQHAVIIVWNSWDCLASGSGSFCTKTKLSFHGQDARTSVEATSKRTTTVLIFLLFACLFVIFTT